MANRKAATHPPSPTGGGRGLLAVVITLLLLLAALPIHATPRIGVATMQPGEIFFERFGHNAIVVDDPALGEPVSYNFGFFDMDEPGFVADFVRGDMHYMLVALPLRDDLAYYQDVGRGVSIQWLDLDDDEAASLAAALAENAKPENARYRYDYFLDNCSTRVRDALDAALDGQLRNLLAGRSRGNTFRGDAVRLASPAWWMWLGFDIGLGPSADKPNSLWRDAFVPMRLADALATAKRTDGRALVLGTVEILPHRLLPEPPEERREWWPWLLVGLVVAIGVHLSAKRQSARVAAVALPIWALCGGLGVLMLFLWLGTEHRFAWVNHNLLLFSPLCLLLLPDGWRIARGRMAGPLFFWVAWLVALGAVVALFLNWLPVEPQRNIHWIALLLPIQVALASTMTRQATPTRH